MNIPVIRYKGIKIGIKLGQFLTLDVVAGKGAYLHCDVGLIVFDEHANFTRAPSYIFV